MSCLVPAFVEQFGLKDSVYFFVMRKLRQFESRTCWYRKRACNMQYCRNGEELFVLRTTSEKSETNNNDNTWCFTISMNHDKRRS